MVCNRCVAVAPRLLSLIVSQRFEARIRFWCWKPAKLSNAARMKSCSPRVAAISSCTTSSIGLSETSSSILVRISLRNCPRPPPPCLHPRRCRRICNNGRGLFTEPSAVAPDAKLNSQYSVNPSNYHHPNLSLASGATALGSVKPRHLSQVQTDPLPCLTGWQSQLQGNEQ